MAIQNRTREIHMRSNYCFRGHLCPKLIRVGRAEHVAHSCHTVGDVKRESGFVIPSVNMHVPQARNQIFACAIQYLAFGGAFTPLLSLTSESRSPEITTVRSCFSVPDSVSTTVTWVM
jgi:hypothetical protein